MEGIALIISVISIFFSMISFSLIFLIQLWNIRLRGIDYRVERYNTLLEHCFGPLINYFNQTVIVYEPHKSQFIEQENVGKFVLHFRAGLLEKIEKIWDQYHFEINRLGEQLGTEIRFILTHAQGKRSGPEIFEPHYVNELPGRFQSDELDNSGINDEDDKSNFEKWKTDIVDQIKEITKDLETKLAKFLEFKEDRTKMIIHLFLPIKEETMISNSIVEREREHRYLTLLRLF